MKQTRAKVFVVLLLLVAALLPANEFKTVAVFDSSRVVLAFYQDSSLYREYRVAEEQYRARLADLDQTISDTQVRRSQALDSGDSRTARRLREELDDLADERNLLQETFDATTADFLDRFSGDEFMDQLFTVVQFLAESGGYTLVVDSAASEVGLFWHSPAIDITEDVIAEMIDRYG